MRDAGKVLLIVIVALMALAVVTTTVWATSEAPRRVDTADVNKFTEAAAAGEEGEHAVKEETKEEQGEEGRALAEGEEGAEEHHPLWMFPGWQSVFTALA